MTDRIDIWMPLYVKDYLGATSRLTTEQHGAYMLLIMDYWLNGPLPDDDAMLAQIARLPPEQWSKHRPSIERLFSVHEGQWRHRRIDREIEAARDRKKQAVERGKLGAKARWEKNGGENGSGNGASIDQASDKQSSKDGSAPSPAQSSTPPQSKSKAKDQEPDGSSSTADEPPTEAKYVIPMTGGKSHPVTQEDIDRYRELYPSIDVEQSIRNMLGWLDSNRDRWSGSVKGAKQRMTSWLARDQDKASRKPGPGSGSVAQQAVELRRQRQRVVGGDYEG